MTDLHFTNQRDSLASKKVTRKWDAMLRRKQHDSPEGQERARARATEREARRWR